MASEDITLLKFPENVRTRFGMFVGSLDDSSVLLREVVDNSVDELYAGMDLKLKNQCNKIWIEIINNQSYLVADNGRGIPIKKSKDDPNITMARLAMSQVSAGSKFKKTSLALGLNGVGSSATNALSSFFSIFSRLKLHDLNELPEYLKEKLPDTITDSTYYYCNFEKGILVDEGFKEFTRECFKGEFPSTITTFSPDTTIAHSAKAKIPSNLQFVKYILEKSGHPSEIIINGKEYKDEYKGFEYSIDSTIKTKQQDSKNDYLRLIVSVGFQPKLEQCQIIGSVNGLDCKQGFHIKLAQNAFDKAFSKVFSNCKRYEFMGLNMGVICLCNEPEFASQTKERMSGADGFRCNEREGKYEIEELSRAFESMLSLNYDVFKNHEEKIIEYLKSTEKIGRKEFIKSTVLIAANTSRPEAFTPFKLSDCSTLNRIDAELYIVEGNSAGSSLMNARDPKIHAVLPLRGKPRNTADLEIEEVLDNREMKDLISSIGVGVNDFHDLSEVRYGKVIIVADADADGKNINALVLGALATHLTFLINAGYVYVAQPPLFEQDGKYFYTKEELIEGKPFGRFKGLGEANPEDLAPFIFDKSTRKLIQITMENWESAREMLTSSAAKREILLQNKVIVDSYVRIEE